MIDSPHQVRLDPESLARTLNAPQLEAVLHYPGPQLILAGAGSGKTRVLTFKIAWLIRQMGLRPFEILAVTFTNKAAQEMRNRVMSQLGYSTQLSWIGTFHSICARILRYHARELGFTSNFTIYDVDDQKRFVKKLLKADGLENDSQYTVDALRYAVGQYKNKGISPEEARLHAADRYEEKLAHLYQRYQAEMLKNNGMDFDDLIYMAIRLLKLRPEIRAAFAGTFRYILIDEYQDTNKAQYQLIQLLLGPHHNLVVVGDDDQSIYGWRGADINNILSFREDFPNAQVTKLEQNYRSSANILGVAGSVIRNNKTRMGKTLWTQNDAGEKVELMEVEDDAAEAAWIARTISQGTRFAPGDTAIFYRINAQSRIIEDELRRRRTPYLIVGGIRFYERKEVKDLLAYLRVLGNLKDSVSLARIINVPKRGIGEKSVAGCVELSEREGINLFQALERCSEAGLNSGATAKLTQFVSDMKELQALGADLPLPDLIEAVIEKTGYRSFLEKEGTDEAMDRLSNIEELVSAAQDFLKRREQRAEEPVEADEPMVEQENSDLDAFLQEISLMADADGVKTGHEAVTLMTVHSAKGLEFPRVFVTGLEDGLFPLVRGEDADMEEERRLFYVAVTRAEKELHISFARRRRRYGLYQEAMGSRFLREIDPMFLRVSGAVAPARSFGSGRSAFGSRTDGDEGVGELPNYEDFSQEAEAFFPGQKVRHGKFGLGTIVSADGSGESARVEVLFQDRTRRRLVLKFAKLELLD